MSRASSTVIALLFGGVILSGCTESGDNDDAFEPGGGASGGQVPDTSPVGERQPPIDAEPPAIDAGSTFFYFSYDESSSTASRDLALFALAGGRRPAPDLGRPYEFLNAESFERFDARAVGDFEVSMTLRRAEPGELPSAAPPEGRLYALGVNVEGPAQPLAERRNVVLTVLVDVSGSMQTPYASETRGDVSSLLDVVKYGLTRIGGSMKAGDELNLVTFSSTADVIAEGLDGTAGQFESLIASLATETSTDIGRGVDLAYQVANRRFDPDKANRVLILTDAQVNSGQLDPAIIAAATVRGELEGIRFSAIGVGSGFDDRVLNTISEAGRGSYSAMITPNDAERLFTDGFSRFVAPAATNVRFRLDYPQALNQLRSFGEEISTDPDAVRPTNFSYDSDQFFLELFQGADSLPGDGAFTLGIEYTDTDGERREVSLTRNVDDLLATTTDALDAAFAVTTLAELIGERIDCGTVQQSALYTQPVQQATYALYRQNIERFCAQAAPYDYVYR